MARIFNTSAIESRSKTRIFFHYKKKLITEYYDELSQPEIIILANQIITYLQNIDHDILNYMVIGQGQGLYVKIVFKNCTDDPKHIAINIYKNIKVNIFCYQYTNNNMNPNINDPVYYLSEQKYIQENYSGISWHRQIDSFIQNDTNVKNIVHQHVNEWMLKYGCNYLGIGGENGFYAKINRSFFDQIICACQMGTNYDDNCYNLPDDIIMDYDDINISNHVDTNKEKWILLCNNLSGLTKYYNDISHLKFEQILYIGCKQKTIKQDLEFLDRNYEINDHICVGPEIGVKVHVINLLLKT